MPPFMFMLLPLLVIMLLAMLPQQASAQHRQHSVITEREMKKRYIDVVGSASVAAKPDTAFVTLLMQTLDSKSAAQSYAANNRAINALVAMLKNQGIPTKDASSSEFSLAPVYSYPQNQPKHFDGFQASQTLLVKIKDLSKVTAVLDGALAAASLVQIVSVSYVVEDTAAIAVKAREEAVKDARDKARRLVDLSGPGVALGKPLSIHEDESGAHVAESAYLQAAKSFRSVGGVADDGGGAASLPGETRVRHTVYITFELLLVSTGAAGEGEGDAEGGAGAALGAGADAAVGADAARGRGRGRGRGNPRRRHRRV